MADTSRSRGLDSRTINGIGEGRRYDTGGAVAQVAHEIEAGRVEGSVDVDQLGRETHAVAGKRLMHGSWKGWIGTLAPRAVLDHFLRQGERDRSVDEPARERNGGTAEPASGEHPDRGEPPEAETREDPPTLGVHSNRPSLHDGQGNRTLTQTAAEKSR